MTLQAINSLVLFMYCYTAHWCSRTRQGLGGGSWNTAWDSQLRHSEYMGMWDPGSLPDVLSRSMAHLISRKASGCLSKQFRQDALSFKIYDEHYQGQANPILCVLSQEITPFLPVMLGSPACIRQFWDETFLGEWMLWQMLSAGNLLKRQLVRGYCSCSVEHSWFTQNGLKM